MLNEDEEQELAGLVDELQRRKVHHTIVFGYGDLLWPTIEFGNGEPISELERRYVTHIIRFGDGHVDAEQK